MDKPLARFELDLPTLRVLNKVVGDAVEKWPGGHPGEQETLKRIHSALYAALMDATLDAS